MSGKRSRWIWIILAAIVIFIGGLSIYNCSNKGTSVDVSDFKEVIAVICDNNKDGTLSVQDVNSLNSNKNAIATNIVNRTKNLSTGYSKIKIDTVKFDGYNLTFNAVIVINENSSYSVPFRSIYGRTNMEEYETALDIAGIKHSYTDPRKD